MRPKIWRSYPHLNDVVNTLHFLDHVVHPVLNCKSMKLYALVIIIIPRLFLLRFSQPIQSKAYHQASMQWPSYTIQWTFIDDNDFYINPFLAGELFLRKVCSTHLNSTLITMYHHLYGGMKTRIWKMISMTGLTGTVSSSI